MLEPLPKRMGTSYLPPLLFTDDDTQEIKIGKLLI